MIRAAALAAMAALLLPVCAAAQPWAFGDPLAVTAPPQPGVFHHLESSGRRNVAVSGGVVGIAWEDNRDGTPRVYLARKEADQEGFDAGVRVSGTGEAYEPSLAALGNGGFALAWEEDGQVLARLVGPGRAGPPLRLSRRGGAQAAVALHGEQLLVLWSEREGRFGRIRMARLGMGGDLTLSPRAVCDVEDDPPEAGQLYPAAAVVGDRVVAAWEDRRHGHTVIMAAVSDPGRPCGFDPPRRVSEDPPGPEMPYGRGHGVARVALAAHGEAGLLAAWADKRRFQEGYDVYAAEYDPADRAFGANQRVQDPFGGVAQQWHVAVAGGAANGPVVAWDDDREGHPDVMLSWPEGGGWSDDLPVPGASGPGEQTHPALVLDGRGRVHLAWVERESRGAPTQVFYVRGEPTGD
jgi:hypothetical protein